MLAMVIRLSIKVLLRRKLYTAVSLSGIVFTLLVLVLGAALVDVVLTPRAPESRQDRMLTLSYVEVVGKGSFSAGGPGYRLLEGCVRALPGSERTSLFLRDGARPLYLQDGSRIVSALKRTDDEFWNILDFTFLAGRAFTAEEVREGRRLAVVSRSTAARAFRGQQALGRWLDLDGERFQVVGVVPDVSLFRKVAYADVWVPITTAPSEAYRQELVGTAGAVVLARRAVDVAGIKDELARRLRRFRAEQGSQASRLVAPLETTGERVARELLGGRREQRGHPERLLPALLGTAVLFMFLPAVNLLNLNVSRILERAGEIGIRKAFGASTSSLVWQFLVENLVLTIIALALTLPLVIPLSRAVAATGLLGATELTLTPRVLLAGLALAIFFGLFSGAYPAWRMSRVDVVSALRGGER
jgi:putative ABC transport system permease protein